jgi:hypothetical protein
MHITKKRILLKSTFPMLGCSVGKFTTFLMEAICRYRRLGVSFRAAKAHAPASPMPLLSSRRGRLWNNGWSRGGKNIKINKTKKMKNMNFTEWYHSNLTTFKVHLATPKAMRNSGQPKKNIRRTTKKIKKLQSDQVGLQICDLVKLMKKWEGRMFCYISSSLRYENKIETASAGKGSVTAGAAFLRRVRVAGPPQCPP